MVESKHVLYGLIAGAVAGIVMGIITYIYMPSVEELLETTKQYINFSGISEDLLKNYLSIALILSPIITFVVSLLLGALFGAFYDYIDRKTSLPSIVSALITGIVFWIILVVPNIVLGASRGKILTNSVWTGIYTITLLILTILKNPRASNT